MTVPPVPTDVMQLKSFLGLVNFYAKFIKNASEILRPLYNLKKLLNGYGVKNVATLSWTLKKI